MKSFEQHVHEAQPVHTLLARLEGVQDRGRGQWLAKCPAHEDNRASLSVKETSDGTILIHCFALCSPAEIVAAVGMELGDLFPRKLQHSRGSQPRWNYRDLLLVIRHEALIVACAAGQIATLTDEELARVQTAAVRIQTALEAAGVR